MKNALVSFAVGLLFALGLGISGMTQPTKIVGFLDLFGTWDPSLLFVMVGAIGVHAVVYLFVKKMKKPLLASSFQLPLKTKLTPALKVGAVLFGLGWALAGYCPGPAVTSLATFQIRPLLFVIAMLAGMALERLFEKKFDIVK